MRFDIEFLKSAGFNMIRKHIKAEPRRYYYHCDRLGMMVWQDQVSAGHNAPWTRLKPDPKDAEWPDEQHDQFMLEFARMIDTLENHPSIVVWVPFNEAWGQHRTIEVGKWAVERDPTRLINIASGGNFWPVGDIVDAHKYPHPGFPFEPERYNDFIKVMGEFGGHGFPVKGHLWDANRRNWGYGGLPENKAEYKSRYVTSLEMLNELRGRGIAGGIYTQTTDVEGEINGLMTYDRKVIKIPANELAQLHQQLFPSAPHPDSRAQSSQQKTAAETDYPIQPVPFTSVEVGTGFWQPRMETNTKVTVPYCFQRCESTGRIRNFVAAAERNPAAFQGIFYNDSDVFKIVEGASYSLALNPDPDLEQYLDALIAKFAAAQEPDGYLYSAKTSQSEGRYGRDPRWTGLDHSHELYNVGHLYEAAVAHFQATGKKSLLNIAIKNADLIATVFGPAAGQRKDVPGHQEIELGLVRLYRVTGDKKYLDLAKFFVDMRGRQDVRGSLYGPYAQDHAPVVRQSEAVGHAVRGGYFYAALADVAALTGESAYSDAIDRIWQDVVDRKLYLTGSVGQHGAGEGYAGAYKLTNLLAYNETCASIALALWNQRMFLLHGDAKYVDVLERILYNGFLSGVSFSGDKFFYPNPLECDLQFRFNHGSLERSPWFNTSCCPSNVARFVPSIPGYVYAVRDSELYVNLFVAGKANIELLDSHVEVVQETDYPWSGKIRLTLRPSEAKPFVLRLRVPGWARDEVLPSDLYRYQDDAATNWSLTINGQRVTPKLEAGFAVLDRTWRPGDKIDLELPMPVRRVLANEKVAADRDRVAFERGPLVYCIEGADHDGSVLDVWMPKQAMPTPLHRPDLLSGVTVLQGLAQTAFRDEDGTVQSEPKAVTMIPYYAWCHRGQNEMAVWLPRSAESAKVPPRPTIASNSKATASHCWSSDSVAALNDQVEPENSLDHGIPRLTWWDHRGTNEWVQYDFVEPTEVAATEVYWFDDTGRGHCRAPLAWQLLYRVGETWKPVQTRDEYGVATDRFNRVEFPPVTTDALRIQVQLQKDFSGGVLEWKVDR